MHPARESRLHRTLREPTVHFAFLAALLFAVGAVAKSMNPPIVNIDPRVVEVRLRQLERSRGTPLTDAERRQVEEAYVDEQILASEARARGLDDDERIRTLLHQKMLHVLAGDVPAPTDDELRTYFEQNRARYAGRPAVTVDEVVVPQRSGTAPGPAHLDERPIGLQAARRSTRLTNVTEGELSWAFGEETAARVMTATIGAWVGPHASADGERWFRVVGRSEASEAPSLEAIRDQVRYDWMAQAEDVLLQTRVAEIRRRYTVRHAATSAAP